MGEDSLDDLGSLDARDDTQCAATHATVFDVDVEDSLEPLHPAHGCTTRRMRLAGGLMGRAGDETAAVFEVRGEHAVVSGEMGAGAWHRASSLRERHFRGGEAGDKVDGVEYDMSGPDTEGVLESVHDLPAVIDREAFVRDGRTGDVAATGEENMNIRTFLVSFLLPSSLCFASDNNDYSCTGLSDTFPCNLTTISWVDVSIQGDLLQEEKSSFEKLIRLRLRDDLSMYRHDVKSYIEFLKEKEYDANTQDMKERGQVDCHVWTVGDNYPVAFLVECELSGWGIYSFPLFDKFDSRVLGFGSKSNVKGQVKESIRELIADISADFLEARDTVKQMQAN